MDVTFSTTILHTISISGSKNEEKKKYERAVNAFQEHLSYLVNPYVTKDLIEQLKTYRDRPIDTSDLFRDFNDLLMPLETKTLLESFCKQIKDYTCSAVNSYQETEQAIKQVQTDLKKIIEYTEPLMQETVKQHWKELNLLLNMPQIKSADSSKVKAILTAVAQGDASSLENVVKFLCDSEDNGSLI